VSVRAPDLRRTGHRTARCPVLFWLTWPDRRVHQSRAGACSTLVTTAAGSDHQPRVLNVSLVPTRAGLRPSIANTKGP